VEEAFMDAVIHTPNLILLDIDAHGENHAESVKYIKQSHFEENVEVLIMTSNRSTTAIIQAFNHGANNYILKTDFTKQILVGKIDHAIGRTPVLQKA
jgi:DNA-binding NarL/FixJ family response regulator